MTDTSTTYIDSEYIAYTDPKKDTISVEPVAHHIACETTARILGYRDLVKIDSPVWTNLMCNELGRLSQGWKAHAGNDTIGSIFHKDKKNERREKYVAAVCDIRPQNTDNPINIIGSFM